MPEAKQKTEWSRQTANFPPDFADKAEIRWRALGLGSWTEYLTWLIEGDLRDRPMVIRTEDGVVFATHFTNSPKQETATKAEVQTELPARKRRRQMPAVNQPDSARPIQEEGAV